MLVLSSLFIFGCYLFFLHSSSSLLDFLSASCLFFKGLDIDVWVPDFFRLLGFSFGNLGIEVNSTDHGLVGCIMEGSISPMLKSIVLIQRTFAP
jgi:hypothetical protein